MERQDSPAAAAPTDDGGPDLHAYARSRRGDLKRQLAEWVQVPGIVGEPGHAKDLLRSANWLAAAFRDIGFPVVEVQPTGESHAVYAEWCAASGAPTVLVYSHHDVRAVKPENWNQTAPFQPVVREGRLYGRGSSDAKGQVLAHLEGIRAHLHQRPPTSGGQTPNARSLTAAKTETPSHSTSPQAGPTPAVNLKFLVEGEEEASSPPGRAPGGAGGKAPGRRRPFLRYPAVARRPLGPVRWPARDPQGGPGGVRPGARRPQRRRFRQRPQPGV
ncbi:M20/M25/M40 family metallo-hydrolase [Arthrobacter sp. SD76]|uniref:M20/M25/M40 family metallo-hydrolase n=1 Tax=Arthrobacter sp. SD76 TaxID=3415007 RepID=UPI003C70DF43